MSSAMLMDRPTFAGHAYNPANFGNTPYGAASFGAGAPSFAPGAMAGMCVVPRATMKFEKCANGFKLHCHCDDETACGALQNLCRMVAGGMWSCACTMNGVCLCQCNLACGMCSYECTKDGVCLTCVSGDKACCQMIQACCDCMEKCMQAGCQCTLSCGSTPVCCGLRGLSGASHATRIVNFAQARVQLRVERGPFSCGAGGVCPIIARETTISVGAGCQAADLPDQRATRRLA